jgi:tetratricopeptide (TPR) repeat protein
MQFKFNLERLFEKLTSTKISRKQIKRNILVEFGLMIRRYFITHKNTVYFVLAGFFCILIIIPIYLKSYDEKIDKANKDFEQGALGVYRQAFADEKLSPEERANLLQYAINGCQYIIENYKDTPVAADALFYQANAYYELGDYNNALQKYQDYVKKYPKKYFSDLAQINIGKCYEQLNNFQAAVEAYQKVISKYPKRHTVPEALYNLGKIYELNNNLNEAFNFYNKLISEHPYSPWAREARLRVLYIQSQIQLQSQIRKK